MAKARTTEDDVQQCRRALTRPPAGAALPADRSATRTQHPRRPGRDRELSMAPDPRQGLGRGGVRRPPQQRARSLARARGRGAARGRESESAARVPLARARGRSAARGRESESAVPHGKLACRPATGPLRDARGGTTKGRRRKPLACAGAGSRLACALVMNRDASALSPGALFRDLIAAADSRLKTAPGRPERGRPGADVKHTLAHLRHRAFAHPGRFACGCARFAQHLRWHAGARCAHGSRAWPHPRPANPLTAQRPPLAQMISCHVQPRRWARSATWPTNLRPHTEAPVNVAHLARP